PSRGEPAGSEAEGGTVEGGDDAAEAGRDASRRQGSGACGEAADRTAGDGSRARVTGQAMVRRSGSALNRRLTESPRPGRVRDRRLPTVPVETSDRQIATA